MPVIGVLGHTDHGKSALIERITGVNPMHLPEEKRRGLTIQLGFGFWDTPSGVPVSFIDVPGHERYLRNMLRGVLAIDGALMVVAADDGVMPGTREHFRASLYAPVRHGLIVITKTDLVSPDRVEEVRAAIAEVSAGSYWEHAEVVACSSVTGDGIDTVADALARIAEQTASELAPAPFAYYFVDRVFAMKGEGVVVTGSLRGREVQAGDPLHKYPGARAVKVRSIEQGGDEMSAARAHFRTAFNLGGLKREGIKVGDLLLSQPAKTGKGLYAALFVEPTEPLREQSPLPEQLAAKSQELNIFVGSALTPVKRLQMTDAGSGRHLALLRLQTELPLASGMKSILFRTSTRSVVLGGWLLDAGDAPRSLRREQTSRILATAVKLLSRVPSESASEPVQVALAEMALHLALHRYLPSQYRPRLSLLSDEAYAGAMEMLRPLLSEAGYSEIDSAFYSEKAIERELAQIRRRLATMGEANPLLDRVPLSSLLPAGSLLLSLPEDEARALLAKISLGYEQGRLLLASEQAIPPQWQDTYERIRERFHGSPAHYPTLTVLKRDFPTSAKLISFLLQRGELVHLGGGVLATGADWQKWAQQVRSFLTRHGKITIGEAKDLLHLTRKYVIPLLEDFDRRGLTKRQGDVRLPGAAFDRINDLKPSE